MADIANRYPENVTGKFFVDNQCIDCDLCRETAPNNFTRQKYNKRKKHHPQKNLQNFMNIHCIIFN